MRVPLPASASRIGCATDREDAAADCAGGAEEMSVTSGDTRPPVASAPRAVLVIQCGELR